MHPPLSKTTVLLTLAIAFQGAVACSVPAGTVDEARAVNDATLSAAALEAGQVALVADGKLHRASSLEEAIALAAALNPPPVHAYLATGGQEGPRRWEASGPYACGNVIGNEALAKLGVAVGINPSASTVTLMRNGERCSSKFSDGLPVVRLRVRPATSLQAFREIDVLVASGFGGGLLLSAEAAKLVDLQRSEEPGITDVVFLSLGESIACRRAFVTVAIDEIAASSVVPAVTPLSPSGR